LYKIIEEENNKLYEKHQEKMDLKPETTGGYDDKVNTVWIMDSDSFPFLRGEQYHQFHSDFREK
jgi:hypothetical protein